MERFKKLDRYQKGILLLLVAMMIIFAPVYGVVSNRVGYLYHDEILVPVQDNECSVYTGKIDGKEAQFTVSDNTVTFLHGEKAYGPYSVLEDPEAVPKNDPRAQNMTGIEIRDGEEVLFRGGCLYTESDNSDFYLYTDAGWYPGVTITATMSDGTVVDGNGNIVDVMKPSIGTILDLVNGPELVSKGQWMLGWFGGVILSVITAVSILFADELFRWRFVFLVDNVDQIEPSGWALTERYIGWTIGFIGVLLIYIMGLR